MDGCHGQFRVIEETIKPGAFIKQPSTAILKTPLEELTPLSSSLIYGHPYAFFESRQKTWPRTDRRTNVPVEETDKYMHNQKDRIIQMGQKI